MKTRSSHRARSSVTVSPTYYYFFRDLTHPRDAPSVRMWPIYPARQCRHALVGSIPKPTPSLLCVFSFGDSLRILPANTCAPHLGAHVSLQGSPPLSTYPFIALSHLISLSLFILILSTYPQGLGSSSSINNDGDGRVSHNNRLGTPLRTCCHIAPDLMPFTPSTADCRDLPLDSSECATAPTPLRDLRTYALHGAHRNTQWTPTVWETLRLPTYAWPTSITHRLFRPSSHIPYQ